MDTSSTPDDIWVNTERQWIDTETGKPRGSEKNLSYSHFVHRKSCMDWPWRERGPPQWEARDNRLSHDTVQKVG
jgi:hypothetical protein